VKCLSRGAILATTASLLLLACGEPVSSATSLSDDGPITLRLGFFPNLTHAPALVGVRLGFFAGALGSKVTLETHTFNAGPDAAAALLSDSMDAIFIGPTPTANLFAQSHGRAIRVIAGTTSGGALLVVKPSIKSVSELKGKKIADPQLGGTQDISLRWFLKNHGFASDNVGGGDVSVVPQDNAQTLTSFKQGQIDGAWVPEPWASRLIAEGGAKVMVDERDLWPHRMFITTNLVVSTKFLVAHPMRVKGLLEGLYQSVSYLNSNATQAQKVTTDAVKDISGKALSDDVVSTAWSHLAFTPDPLAETLKTSADRAHKLGLLPTVNLNGLYDLALLNEVLAEHNQARVNGL